MSRVNRFAKLRSPMLAAGMAAVGLTLASPTPGRAEPQLIAPSCGDTIGPGGSWRLAHGVGPCPGDETLALRIVGPTRVDFDGAIVMCNTTNVNDGRGIHVSGQGARLQNATVRNCDSGVRVQGGGHRFKGFVVEEFDDAAFEVVGDGNFLVRNIATGGGDTAYHVVGNGNTLRENDFRGGIWDLDAFQIEGDANKLIGNRSQGDGFTVVGDGNLINGNTASTTHFAGFTVSGAENRVLRNTSRLPNNRGSFHIGGQGNLIKSNFAADWNEEEWSGFAISGSGKLVDNVAAPTACQGSGYYLAEATDLEQSGNQTVCP